MKKTYFLIEAANTHGGDFEYLLELIDAFAHFQEGFGIKFQAFHPDKIATEDYPSHHLYQQLHFKNNQWKTAIEKAFQTKDIWLDVFDTYGVEVLQENHEKVFGIKFQSSVLYNYEVFRALRDVDLSLKKIILNVAAQPLERIQEIITRVEKELKPQEILLEFGYQAYPTSLEDSGYSKLQVIKDHFKNRIVFADHVDGNSEDGLWLPVMVTMAGVDIIEKHAMLSKRETKYDHYSSLTPEQFQRMVEKCQEYALLTSQPFINKKEEAYLKKTMMVPILKNDKKEGDLIDLQNDLVFRRTIKDGLNAREIKELVKGFNVLACDKNSGETIIRSDFRKAKIGIIVVGRMKSTRLPQKALKKIGNLSSIEYCIKNVLRIKNIDKVILATSNHLDDAILEHYTFSKSVGFFRGDPDDVMKRMADVAKIYQLDIVSRVTADMPYVPNEFFQMGLRSHFEIGADYTQVLKAPIGTATGIISSKALFRAKKLFPSALYSEYLRYYFINNPSHFKINNFEIPLKNQRDYRLTIDYQQDLDLFNEIEKYFKNKNKDISLNDLYEFLENNPDIASINKGLIIKYKDDKDLINKINKHSKLANKS